MLIVGTVNLLQRTHWFEYRMRPVLFDQIRFGALRVLESFEPAAPLFRPPGQAGGGGAVGTGFPSFAARRIRPNQGASELGRALVGDTERATRPDRGDAQSQALRANRSPPVQSV